MKKILLFFMMGLPLYGQVGIGITEPIATLDINGTLNIRTIAHSSNTTITKEKILTSENGMVTSMTATEIVNEALPTAVKGSFSVSSGISLSLLTGSALIPFDQEDFDVSNEFDTTTHEFTATRDGIYEINSQIVLDATIGAATNLGLRLLKNGTVIHKQSFASVSLLGTNVSPPTRTVQTLLALQPGDVITFEIEGDIALGTIDIEGDSVLSFFTIQQI
ncbi:MAG TPA: hypothetical protein DEA82_05190 [Flavobacteriaceae bacterium]|nr:hypothetical protein [Flavobacteriaceae bacterium]HBR53600.1 hypothetical protein [Flavobacteriaceae bacterium]